jgi:OmpA-OmpF porin, OOP family
MRTLVPVLGLVLAGWIGGGTWYWVCKVRALCDGGTPAVAPPAAAPLVSRIPPLTVSYQQKPLISRQDNFRFPKGDSAAVLSPAVRSALDTLATYLLTNPGTEVELTASFAAEEGNKSGKLNLGLARAGFVQSYLLGKGVPAKRMITLYKEDSSVFSQGDTLLGGMEIRVLDKAIATAPGTPEVKFEPRNLYFGYKSDNIDLNDSLRSYISQTIQYLRQHPEKKLQLTGHTDNVGSAAYNRSLGLGRAKTVKRFFQEFGMAEDQIRTDSQGPAKPIAPNDTEEGRSKNRRVEIKVQ